METINKTKIKVTDESSFWDDVLPGCFRKVQFSSFNKDKQEKDVEIRFRFFNNNNIKANDDDTNRFAVVRN